MEASGMRIRQGIHLSTKDQAFNEDDLQHSIFY